MAEKLSTTELRHYDLPSLEIAFAYMYVTEAYLLVGYGITDVLLSTDRFSSVAKTLYVISYTTQLRSVQFFTRKKSIVITLSRLGK